MNHESNELAQARLARAILAVKHLDTLGCVVGRVDVGPRPPVIHITGGKGKLPGAFRKRCTIGAAHVYTMIAIVEGCEVHWQEEDFERRAPDALDYELPPCIGERMRDVAFDLARNGADA
jgi:hypothetical protein